jgi:hypothetical protein
MLTPEMLLMFSLFTPHTAPRIITPVLAPHAGAAHADGPGRQQAQYGGIICR